MVRNYLKIAIRNLLKEKVFSLINILGLAIGIASFLLIFTYIQFEESYENFIPDNKLIYRVKLEQYINNELGIASAENYPGVGPAFLEDLPEVTSFARLYNMGYKNNVVITYQDAPNGPVQFKHRSFLYADSAFLPMFGYKMKLGDAVNALADPFTAVMSESNAKKYFGDEDPIGKMIRLQDDDFNDELVKVTGVFYDLPQNTHLKPDLLFSYETLFSRGNWAPGRYGTSWQRKDMYVYIKVLPETDINSMQVKFPGLVEKYNPGLADRNRRDVLSLQPLNSIHLNSNLAEEFEPNGDAKTIGFLKTIAGFILIIAWVNYINLSTAKAMERAGEVGVRKVMGAFKGQLRKQFLIESGIVNLTAIFTSLLIIIVLLPMFSNLTGTLFSTEIIFEKWFLSLTITVWVIGTFLSGLYPAFVLSSFKPVSILKGKIRKQGNSAILRKGLVVLQFAASVSLIASTLVIYNQLNYMKSQDLGIDIEQVLVVERPGVSSRDRNIYRSNVDLFKNELKSESSIKGVTGSLTIPGKKREFKSEFRKYGSPIDENVALRLNGMDYDFVETFGMKVIAGRTFNPDFQNDPDTSVVITESASRILGFENPEEAIGKTLSNDNFQWHPIIVGVVNDYHQESLQKEVDPILFFCSLYGAEFYSMKVETINLPETIASVEASWNKAFPGNPFNYFFMDDYFNQQYNNEEKFGDIFGVFALLAIFVGGLGLFALSAFSAQQRTKEIGIRKVLGSTVNSIVLLLNKDFIVLVIIANLIAWPITWYFMEDWLAKFATRVELGIVVFLISGLIVFLFSLITVSFQTLKAARVAPVQSLKYE